MVFTTEGLSEVAIESWPEWDLNPAPLNSTQILYIYIIYIYIYITYVYIYIYMYWFLLLSLQRQISTKTNWVERSTPFEVLSSA